MAQKHQRDVSTSPCPNPACREPVEPGDLFCGACGYDLTSAPLPDEAQGRAPAEPGGGAGPAPVSWPQAQAGGGPDASVSTQHPGDLPGVDSHGARLSAESGDFVLPSPGGGAPAGGRPEAPAGPVREAHAADPAAVRADLPQDPRAAGPGGSPQPGEALCVACRAGRVDSDGYCENCGHAQPRERDHVERDLGAVAAVSDRGLRHHRNEDAFAVSTAAAGDGTPAVIAVVCDGVSSAARPDEASAAASSAAEAALLAALPRGTHPQQAMHEAIVTAAQAVDDLVGSVSAAGEPGPVRNAPACTIVGAVALGGLLAVGWVGDSRAYWVPDDRTGPAARLTEDDSWAAQMVAAGLMSEAEAYADERAHAITGWLGADAYELEPHTVSFKPDRPGTVVVCTDGLWNYAEGVEEMARAVPADASARPLHAARVLVGHALDGGGHDNVTVAVLPFAPPVAGAESACAAT
ncbi:protein phosphatase 2C domain-containing protein [Streptomyces sp. NPDC047002]|uniref:PP2C family protein-serine/threonine phosphatase n=1 Tax=Streptomyces sp. NPDC047002 TaxID=3155475 RepID=UPI003457110B